MSYIVFSSQDIYNLSLSKTTKNIDLLEWMENMHLKRNVSVAKLRFVALVYLNSQKLTLS